MLFYMGDEMFIGKYKNRIRLHYNYDIKKVIFNLNVYFFTQNEKFCLQEVDETP